MGTTPGKPTPSMIEVASGEFVSLRGPEPSTIKVDDIAHALSHICRFGGHTHVFYSVAQHSLLVHDLVEHLGASPEVRLAALLHDAHEAYVGDLTTPLKRELRGGPLSIFNDAPSHYDHAVTRIDRAITTAITQGTDLDLRQLLKSRIVVLADAWALSIEARQFLPSRGEEWAGDPDQLPYGGHFPPAMNWPWILDEVNPSDIRADWMALFHVLSGKIGIGAVGEPDEVKP